VEAYPSVADVTYPDLSNLQVVGGFLLLAGLFILREFASGALKEAGKDLWGWVKTRRSTRRRRVGKGPAMVANRSRFDQRLID
jgi:hypothetical protein